MCLYAQRTKDPTKRHQVTSHWMLNETWTENAFQYVYLVESRFLDSHRSANQAKVSYFYNHFQYRIQFFFSFTFPFACGTFSMLRLNKYRLSNKIDIYIERNLNAIMSKIQFKWENVKLKISGIITMDTLWTVNDAVCFRCRNLSKHQRWVIIFRSFCSNFLKDFRQKWQNVVDFFIFSIIDKRRMYSSMNFIPRYVRNHDDDDEDTRAISTIWRTQIFV